MFGKLLSIAGMFGMSLRCILCGHHFWRRMSRNKIEHGCQNCGGTGSVPYSPKESAVFMYRQCTACKGTGVDPAKPIEDKSRRDRRRDRKDSDKAPWQRSGRKVKVAWPTCTECGKVNPNWSNPETMRPGRDEGLIKTVLRWWVGP